MANNTMRLSVTFCESGTSGFLLKDTTGIGVYKFMPQEAAISATYYRTCDVALYDIVTFNKIDDKKVSGFIYDVKSDEGYIKYSLNYQSVVDGWFTVDHLVLPTREYINTVDRSSFEDGMYYIYDRELDEVHKLDFLEGEIISDIKVDELYVKENLTNKNLIGIEEEIFLIGHLEKCLENMIKYILYNNLYSKCLYKDTSVSNLYQERDLVWMSLELIHRLIKDCNYYEAQRLLERISACNGFCKKDFRITTNKYISTGGCNCK